MPVRINSLSSLSDAPTGNHVLGNVLLGGTLYLGGLSFHPPGTITHDHHRPHLESDQEAFVILQGRGRIEVDGNFSPVSAGDVIVIEPGEDHHLHCEGDIPLVNLWLHAKD